MRQTARLLHPRVRLRRHSSSCYGWREPAEASGIAGRGVEGVEEIWGGPRRRGQALTRLPARYPVPTALNSFARNIAAASLLMITERLFKGGSQWCSNTMYLHPCFAGSARRRDSRRESVLSPSPYQRRGPRGQNNVTRATQ